MEGRKGSGKMTRKAFLITFGVIMAVIIAVLVWGLTAEAEKTWDSEHPMANARVTWLETFHAGGWSEAE